jgi:hypothetical protein
MVQGSIITGHWLQIQELIWVQVRRQWATYNFFLYQYDKSSMIMNRYWGAIATAGNDHRLGANEAPPAIISVFIEQLTKVLAELEGVTQEIVSEEKTDLN